MQSFSFLLIFRRVKDSRIFDLPEFGSPSAAGVDPKGAPESRGAFPTRGAGLDRVMAPGPAPVTFIFITGMGECEMSSVLEERDSTVPLEGVDLGEVGVVGEDVGDVPRVVTVVEVVEVVVT